MVPQVFVGNKKIKIYCGVALLHLFTSKEVQILARGRHISRAVHVAERLQNTFSNLKVKSTKIGQETFKVEKDHERHVSTISITLEIAEGEYPIMKQSVLDLKIENGSCFICTTAINDILFNLPTFLFLNNNVVDFRKFKRIQQEEKILRKIPSRLFLSNLNKVKFLVLRKEIFRKDVIKLPTPVIENASTFLFEKKIKVSVHDQSIETLEKVGDWSFKASIDGKPVSISVEKFSQRNIFQIEVLDDAISFKEKHRLSIWIESKEAVSSDRARVVIPAFEPKLEDTHILGTSYKVIPPKIISVPVKVVASIPGVADELVGENELELSSKLIELVKKSEGDINKVQIKAKLIHGKYIGKEIVKDIEIKLPDPKLEEKYIINMPYVISVTRDFPVQVKILASLEGIEELSEINTINLHSALLDFVKKNSGSKNTVKIKVKFAYGKLVSNECEKEVEIRLPLPKLEFPEECMLRKDGEQVKLIAKEENLLMKIVGPNFLKTENIIVDINEIPVEVHGSEGKFQLDLYEFLKLGQENVIKCRFEYGKLVGEVTYSVFRESILIETMHKILAFQSFSLKITCDHSLIGQKLKFLEKEIEIKKTDFEEKFLAGEPGEYLLKVSTTQAGVPEKEISFKFFPYFYVESKTIYNKAREKLSLRIFTDPSISEEEIVNIFTKIKIKGRKQNYKLKLESSECVKTEDNRKIWKVEYCVDKVFPSKYELGPFSIKKNEVTSTAESRSIVVLDINEIEIDHELIYGRPVRKVVIKPKNSSAFFDELYDEDLGKFNFRLEVVRRSPFVYAITTSNPKDLWTLDKYLQRVYNLGPGKYAVRLLIRGKPLFEKEVMIYGAFLREKSLFVGHPSRVHIFAESNVQVNFGGENVEPKKVAEYYYIAEVVPKRPGEVKLQVKVNGKTILLSKTYSVSEPKIEKIAAAKTLEEILKENLTEAILIYDKDKGKFVGNGTRCPEHFKEISKGFGLKGIVLHPLFALNEENKDYLFGILYRRYKSNQKLRVGFLSLPAIYGGRILSQSVAEKVSFIPIVQTKCEECGHRSIVLVKDENGFRLSCTSCKRIDPEKIAYRVVNIPEIFRCPECTKSWLLPCYSEKSSNSKIILVCTVCLTKIDYCYFTMEEFEKLLPDVLFISTKLTEWLRSNYTYLLEQKVFLCAECGRVHPICLLFQIKDYERVLDEVEYNWGAIYQRIQGLINEMKVLREKRKILRRIGRLNKIKETKDERIFNLLKKAAFNDLDTLKLKELFDQELTISKRCSEIKMQLDQIFESPIRKLIYLIKRALGLETREKELVTLKEKLKDIQKQKESWFLQIRNIADKKIKLLKKELRKLPRTKYRNLELLNQAIQSEIDAITTSEQRKVINVLKKRDIITGDYQLRKEMYSRLKNVSKCFFCGGKVEKMPPISFLFVVCQDSVLVSPDLISFSVDKDCFVNDFYGCYEPLVSTRL